MNIQAQIRGRQSAKRGMATEHIAELWLMQQGYACVERIETPWRIHRSGGKIVRATPKARVSGDFTAIEPYTGRHVHVEVKSRKADVLKWSDFEEHQISALNRKAEAGASCLVIWVKSLSEIRVYEWPIPGFGPGKSLKWEA